MTNEEKIEALRRIVNAKAMTAGDKALILEICDEQGIARPAKKNCRACWIETALVCYNALTQSAPKLPKNGQRYVLKSGVDVLFGSVRVNEATLTDELAEKLLARGFDRKFFDKCE